MQYALLFAAQPNAADIECFRVYRRDVGGEGGYAWLADVHASAAGFVDAGERVLPGISYEYTVTSVDEAGNESAKGVMKDLITTKLLLPKVAQNSDEHWDLMNTVNGFRAHNAADRIVHFSFFRSALEDMTSKMRAEAWVIHHNFKEPWADYILLEQYGYSDKQLHYKHRYRVRYFNHFPQNSAVKPVEKETWFETEDAAEACHQEKLKERTFIELRSFEFIDTEVPQFTLWGDTGVKNLGFKGNAELMHRAQLVFRKNRRSLATYSDSEYLSVQSVEDLKEKLDPAKNGEADFTMNLFSHCPWALWYHPFTGNLAVLDYRDENKETHSLELSTPIGHEREIYQLNRIRMFLEERKERSGEDGFEWTLWTREEVFKHYDKSVTMAEDWMYDNKEITLRHHK
jgi:hypothetical protein